MIAKSILKGIHKPELLKDETLADIFRSTAQKFPDKIALVFQNQTLTYKQLDSWSDEVASNLYQLGIGSGNAVGLWYPRSLELHVAVLGIVKAGATYVPLDREMPKERVEAVLTEVGASVCFAIDGLSIACSILNVPSFPSELVDLPAIATSSNNRAYVLYTSGSTGKPKGIPITQKQICHFVRAEQEIIGIKSEDKVYQGFSVSFDMWCEETWISYLAGATLYVADAASAKAIDEVSTVLIKHGITILHAVPSLLAIMDDDIPTLRLINAGGEACTPQVLAKWAKDGRVFYNSYGPTETTVTSSMIALKKGDAITIGHPLPNYNYAIMDEQLNILPCGYEGELVVTGPCVGEGYIELPELTASKFVVKPIDLIDLPGEKIYRTGDHAIIHEHGEVEFLGRIDDQIKLRGYRIELGEIENRLSAAEGILSAAVAVKKDNNDQEQLVGYVIVKDKTGFDEQRLRNELALNLAPYMVPGVIVRLDAMPRLPSGKINRKALPLPDSFQIKTDVNEQPIDANAALSERMIAVLKKVFPGKEINLSMDFFTDLGGHSLLAASFVSKLRKEGGVKNASLKDIYLNRPLNELSSYWSKEEQVKENTTIPFQKIPWWRYYTCWTAQTIALCLIYGLFAVEVFLPYLGYYYTELKTGSHFYALLTSLIVFCLVPPLLVFISILGKWIIIGKMKEGDYPLWGTYYFRWWIVNAMQDVVPVQFFNGTPLYPIYLRLRGVKVAADAQLSSFKLGAEDLVSIGSDVSISSGVVLDNAVVEKGMLRLRKITIGNHAYIGSSSVIGGNTIIEDWGELKDLSYLAEGQTIQSAQVWNGSPAIKVASKTIEELPHPPEISKSTRFNYTLLFLGLLLIFPFAVLIPLLPVIYALNELDNAADDYDFHYLIVTPALALMYTVLFAVFTVVVTRLLQKKVKPGVYPVYSLFYVRKWLADQFMELSLMVMHPVYATIYIPTFFRALGAKVGKHTEISTANNVTHPLLKIGEGSFIADAVVLGEADVRAQSLILNETVIGNRSFVGNSALIPQGYQLPDNMLIGVLSTPPTVNQLENGAAKDWFGSPAIALPHRQDSGKFDTSLTMLPSKPVYIARAIVELIRIIIPETVILCCSLLFIAYVHDLLIDGPWWKFLLLFPLYYLAYIGLPCFLITVVLKWLAIGKYKEEQMPMWTFKVWRSEAITSIYEALAVPFFLQYLKGTPWLPFLLRLLGVKTGERIWMNTTDITEFDMVSIADDAALNAASGPQTHLFEDRVMKTGAIKIGARTAVGSHSIILYSSEIGDDVTLDPLSLVMKGENLPNNTNWGGSPVRKS
jgi:non-ribosomal peptide synthetase-like protein